MHTFYIYIYFILYFLEMDIFIILLECVLFLNLIVTLFFFVNKFNRIVVYVDENKPH